MDADWVKVSSSIHAPRAEVFAALTSAERLPLWWAAGWSGCAIVACEVHAAPGGAFRIDSQTKRGSAHFWRGVFLHVADDLLHFTLDTDRSRNAASAVIIGLRADDGATEITVEHSGLVVDDERAVMRRSWQQLLVVLDRGLRRLSPQHIEAELARFRAGDAPAPTGGGTPCR